MKRLLSYVAFFLLIFGGIFIWMSVSRMIFGTKTPVDLNSLTPEMLEKNLVVEGELECNYGPFMEEYETRYGIKTSGSQYTYLIPIGEYEFMGIKTLNESLKTAFDKQAEDTISYIYEETYIYPDTIHVIGRIKKLDSERLGYMKEYLVYMGFTQEEADRYACPYYLSCETYDNWSTGLLIGIANILAGMALIYFTIIRHHKSRTPVVTSPLPQVMDDYTNFTPYESSTHTSNESFEQPYEAPHPASTNDEPKDTPSTSKFGFKLDDN